MFAEDGQTFYVKETAPGVYNDGHGGYDAADVGIPEWGIRHATRPQMDDRSWAAKYRQCCTASAWSGFILAARVLDLKDKWKHNALFDYQDRYMDVTDRGGTHPGWRSTSPFAEQMWDRYRPLY